MGLRDLSQTSVTMSCRAALSFLQAFTRPGSWPAMKTRTPASISWQHAKDLSNIFSSPCRCWAHKHCSTLVTIRDCNVELLWGCFWDIMGIQDLCMNSAFIERWGPRETSTSSHLNVRLSEQDRDLTWDVASFSSHSTISAGVLLALAILASFDRKFKWLASESHCLAVITLRRSKASVPFSVVRSGSLVKTANSEKEYLERNTSPPGTNILAAEQTNLPKWEHHNSCLLPLLLLLQWKSPEFRTGPINLSSNDPQHCSTTFCRILLQSELNCKLRRGDWLDWPLHYILTGSCIAAFPCCCSTLHSRSFWCCLRK